MTFVQTSEAQLRLYHSFVTKWQRGGIFMLTKHCLQEFILDCQLRRLSPRTVKGYPTMYLDGYTPYEILQATSRKMYNDHLERQEEAIIPTFHFNTTVKIR